MFEEAVGVTGKFNLETIDTGLAIIAMEVREIIMVKAILYK